MKRIFLIVFIGFKASGLYAQNVGIGTITPRAPLSFPPTIGQKIALWDDGNPGGANYGIGVQGGLLQIHAYTVSDNIAFGYGSSSSFTEVMRIKGNGNVGIGTISPSYRLHLGNSNNALRIEGPAISGSGGNAMSIGGNGDIEIDKPGVTGGRLIIKENGNIGIGNNNPGVPLAFAASLGKKITLYPGVTGDAGFGIAGNRLQIFADNPGADVAIGYDAAGIFTEKFAFKSNGAFAVNGNTGSTGQLLMSNGTTANPVWTSAASVIKTEFGPATTSLDLTNFSDVNLTASDYTVTLTVPSRVILFYKSKIFRNCTVGECSSKFQFTVFMDNQYKNNYECRVSGVLTGNASYFTDMTNGPDIFDLGPGTYSFTFKGNCGWNPPMTIQEFKVFSTIIPL